MPTAFSAQTSSAAQALTPEGARTPAPLAANDTLRRLIDSGQVSDPGSARGRLLACAAHLFREKGFERTTVRDIAAEVGIQSGSLFHHFRSKEAILKAVMSETIVYNTASMQLAASQAGSARDALLALIRCELESINGQTGEAMAVLVYEWRSLSDASQRDVLVMRDHYEQIWFRVLKQAQDEGLVKADPQILRRLLTGALSWTITWFKPQGPMTLDDLAAEVLRMLGIS